MQSFFSIKKMVAIYIAIIFFIALDRWLKVLVLTNPGQQFNLIGEILKFNFKANYHIAFSLPLAGPALIILLFLIIFGLVWLALFYALRQSYYELAVLSLIILGASSNLFDRLRYGFVVDYLDLQYFTVFNLADTMITTGVILFIVSSNKKSA